MIDRDEHRRSDRGRLLWSFLASVLLNTVAWVTLSAQLSLLRHVSTEAPSEMGTHASSLVYIERRTVPRPRHRPESAHVPQPTPQPPTRRRRRRRIVPAAPPETLSLAPPQPAALALPRYWARQDFGNEAAAATALWLDRTKKRGAFVPRVFLWQLKTEPVYLQRPSLHDVVQDVLSALRARGVKVRTSKAQPVCGGERPGWFVSYVNPADDAGDAPLHVDETFFMAGDTVYRATYIRLAAQPEDARTRAALNTLCS